MPFRLRVTGVEYDKYGNTALIGALESGQIGCGDSIRIPTESGTLFHSVVTSMEGPGPDPPPFRADKIGKATLFVGVQGTPLKKDVTVPCEALAFGGEDVSMPSSYDIRHYRGTGPFFYNGEKQFVAVEDSRETVRRRLLETKEILDETICPVTSCGCAIDGIDASPSGSWLVTQRISGQGEWGYDVFRTCPLSRVGGTPEEDGIMIDIPKFSPDERRVVGGFGRRWLGGWWAHGDDEFEQPARGGLVSFGFVLVHHLPSHQVERHELKIDLPRGWLPDDPDDEIWYGAREITPGINSVRMSVYGGVEYEIAGSLPPVILLPTPHPSGRELL